MKTDDLLKQAALDTISILTTPSSSTNVTLEAGVLDKKCINYVQQVVGSLLYYAQAIDGKILPALNTIGSEQAKPTVSI